MEERKWKSTRGIYACRPRSSSWKALHTPRTLSLPLWTEGRFNVDEMAWPEASSKS